MEGVKNIVASYERASGEAINLNKSMISYSWDVHDYRFNELKQAVGS